MNLQIYQEQYHHDMIDMICSFYEAHTNFLHLPTEKRKKQEDDAQETLTGWQDDAHQLFILMEKQEVCGFLHIEHRSKTVVWIEDIYVGEKFRRQGIATQAIYEAEAILKQDSEIQAICMDVIPRNQAALHLYHSLGYDSLSLLTLRKEMKENPRKQETSLFDLTFKV